MTEKENSNNSLIPITSTGLVRVGNSIAVTNKLLSESKYQFVGDFKGYLMSEQKAHSKNVNKIEQINGTNFIITIGDDGFIRLWDTDGIILFYENRLTNNWLFDFSIYYYDDNISVIVSGASGEIYRLLFDKNLSLINFNRKLINDKPLISLAVSLNNNLLIGCSYNKIILCNLDDLTIITTKSNPHNLGCNKLIVNELNNIIITVGDDEKIKLWDILNLSLIEEVHQHRHWVTSIINFNSENNIISGSCDMSFRIWDITHKQQILSIDNEEWIVDLKTSKNNCYLAVALKHKLVKVFDTKSFQLITTFRHPDFYESIDEKQNYNWINCVSFGSNDKVLFTGCKDGILRKWK